MFVLKTLTAAALTLSLLAAPVAEALACGPYGPRPTVEQVAASRAEQHVRELLPGVIIQDSDAVVDAEQAIADVRVTRREPDRRLQITVRHDAERGAIVESTREVRALGKRGDRRDARVWEADAAARSHLATVHQGSSIAIVGSTRSGETTILDVELSRLHTVQVELTRDANRNWKAKKIVLPAVFKRSA